MVPLSGLIGPQSDIGTCSSVSKPAFNGFPSTPKNLNSACFKTGGVEERGSCKNETSVNQRWSKSKVKTSMLYFSMVALYIQNYTLTEECDEGANEGHSEKVYVFGV